MLITELELIWEERVLSAHSLDGNDVRRSFGHYERVHRSGRRRCGKNTGIEINI